MKKPSRSRSPLQIAITRRPGAPAAPGKQTLTTTFDHAWRITPKEQRPDTLGAKKITVDILVVDDAEIGALNVTHLKHAGPTDVLSFPMGEYDPERKAYHLGDIVVSHQTAAREAEARGLKFSEELS